MIFLKSSSAVVLFAGLSAFAAPINRCFATLFNRSVELDSAGNFELENVPAGVGRSRVRILCTDSSGVSKTGTSEVFEVVANQVYATGPIVWDVAAPIPVRVKIEAGPDTMKPGSLTRQAKLRVQYADSSWKEIPDTSNLTTWFTSNPRILQVDARGNLTAVRSGRALLTAIHEGNGALTEFHLSLSADSDADGIPDDWEIANGLDPSNALDALEDLDKDGLNNLQEFQAGTDPRNRDTDGDGLSDGEELKLHTNPMTWDTDGDGVSDGLEVTLGTNPLDASSVDWARTLKDLAFKETRINMVGNAVLPGEVSATFQVVGRTQDGRVVDFNHRPELACATANPTVAFLGTEAGRILAGQEGLTTLGCSFAGHSAQLDVRVTVFQPTPLSMLELGVHANRIAVREGLAFIASDSGLITVDVSLPTNPSILSRTAVGDAAMDVLIHHGLVWLSTASGKLVALDVSNPAAPQQVGSVSLGGEALGLASMGDTMVLAHGMRGMTLVDIHDPTHPEWIESHDLRGRVRTVAVRPGGGQILTGMDGGVVLFQLAGGRWIESSSTALRPDGTSYPAHLLWTEVGAWAADGAGLVLGGVRNLEVSSDGSLLRVATSSADNVSLKSLAQQGRLLAASDIYMINGVPLYDLGDGHSLTERGALDFMNLPGAADDNGSGLALQKGFVYLVAGPATDVPVQDFNPSRLYIGRAFVDATDTSNQPPRVQWDSSIISRTFLKQRNPLDLYALTMDDFGIDYVDFEINGVRAGRVLTSPYYLHVTLPDTGSQVRLRVIAVDRAGAQASDSITIPLLVDSIPVIQWVSPINGSVFAPPAPIQILVNVQDEVGIERVELWAEDQLVSTNNYPFSPNVEFQLATLGGPLERHLQAKARDFGGNEVSSAKITVHIIPDTVSPIARIISLQTDGIPVSGRQRELRAIASDDVYLRRVVLEIDGNRIDSLVDPEYRFLFTLGQPGRHQAKVIAIDYAGNQGVDSIQFDVVADPLTTVRGRVLDAQGNPVSGARVRLEFADTVLTDNQGLFQLAGVPTVRPILAEATFTNQQGKWVGHSELVEANSADTWLGDLQLSKSGTFWTAGHFSRGNYLGFYSMNDDPPSIREFDMTFVVPKFKDLQVAWNIGKAYALDSLGNVYSWSNGYSMGSHAGLDSVINVRYIGWPLKMKLLPPLVKMAIAENGLFAGLDSSGRIWVTNIFAERLDSLPAMKDLAWFGGNLVGLDSSGNALMCRLWKTSGAFVNPEPAYELMAPKIQSIRSGNYGGILLDSLGNLWKWSGTESDSAVREIRGQSFGVISQIKNTSLLLADDMGVYVGLKNGKMVHQTYNSIDTFPIHNIKAVNCYIGTCIAQSSDNQWWAWNFSQRYVNGRWEDDQSDFLHPFSLNEWAGCNFVHHQWGRQNEGSLGLDSLGEAMGLGYSKGEGPWQESIYAPTVLDEASDTLVYPLFPKIAIPEKFLLNGYNEHIGVWLDTSATLWGAGNFEWLYSGRVAPDGRLRPRKLEFLGAVKDVDVPNKLLLSMNGVLKKPSSTGWSEIPLSEPIEQLGISVGSHWGDVYVIGLSGNAWVWSYDPSSSWVKFLTGNQQIEDSIPRIIPSLRRVKKIAGTRYGKSFALKEDGHLWSWDVSQDEPPSEAKLSGVQDFCVTHAPDAVIALMEDGTLRARGELFGISPNTEEWQRVDGINDIRSLYCDMDNILAVRRDGKVYYDGFNLPNENRFSRSRTALPLVKNVRTSGFGGYRTIFMQTGPMLP